MLSAFTYYADYSVEIPYQPGNIVIADTTVEGADKLFHYNRSGNEIWQTNRPLANVRFERVTAENLAQPAVLYGEEAFLLSAKFCQVHMTVREGCEETPLFWVCNYDDITLEDVTVEGGADVPLIQTWSDRKINIKGLSCTPKRTNIVERAATSFGVKEI